MDNTGKQKQKQLTDMQKAFLSHLVGEARGDLVLAKKMAGYSDNTPTSELIKSLRDEIIDSAKDILVVSAPRAAVEIASQIVDPTKAGASIAARAAQEVLDRVGVTKSSGDVTLKVPEGGLVILPAKQENPHANDITTSTDISGEVSPDGTDA